MAMAGKTAASHCTGHQAGDRAREAGGGVGL